MSGLGTSLAIACLPPVAKVLLLLSLNMASAQVRGPAGYLRSHRSLLHAGGHSAHHDLLGALDLAVGGLQIPC